MNKFLTKSKPLNNFSRKFFKLAILALVMICFLTLKTEASHYRYGNISWSRINSTTRTITITVTQAWRRSFFGAPVVSSVVNNTTILNFGDGLTTPINITVTSINLTEDWFYGTFTVSHTYAGTATAFTLSYTSNARIGAPLQNNANGQFRSQSFVSLTAGNTGSPVSSTPPIINLPVGQVAAAFSIPATDPDATALTYALATSAQTLATNPAGLAISSTGNATFNTVGKVAGQLWQGAFVITDASGSNTIVDFMMFMVAANTPPIFDYSITPANNAVFNINPAQNLSFSVKALCVDAGSTVTLSAVGLPIGNFTFTPGLPVTANPVTSAFSFTPTFAQLGIYQITFTATRNGGVQSSTTVTVNVNTNPLFISPTRLEGSGGVILSNVLNVDIVTATNPDPNVNTSITSGTIPAGATITPGLPTAFSTTPSIQMNWTPTVADYGVHNISFLATDANGRTTTRNYMLEVNTVPVFGAKSDDNILPCTPYSYTITAIDPDMAYGDIVDILAHGTLPSWLTLTQTGNGTATLSGTPLHADAGTYAIEIVAEDLYHHVTGEATLTFNIVVMPDATPPPSPVLPDITGECTATATAPTTTDVCAGTITGTTTDALTISTQGTYVIHWTFNDGNGNTTTANQNIIVDDVTAPVTPTLADVTGECTATATAPTTTDVCAGTISGTTSDPLSYSTQGTHVIHWTFDDGNGNTTTANQNVIVDDVTAPATPTLADVTGECTATAGVATTTDVCAGTISGTTSDPLLYSTQGTHVIHWTFDDGNGNTTTANQNVIVDDVTPPATPTLANVTGECSATASVATTTDVCAGTITGTTTDALSYNTQGTHVIHWTFDDGNGNTTTADQNVIIADITAPTISCPGNIVLSACQSTATWTEPSGNDNCTGWTVSRMGPAPGSTFANGSSTTITYTVTDVAGLTANCSFTVTRATALGAAVTNNNPVLYFGFTLDQLAKITVKPTGGTGPYTVAFVMNRPINCNLVNSSGDEKWTHGANTSLDSNIICVSTTLPNTKNPGSTSTNTITSATGYSLDVTLMQDAIVYITVTDANGCVYLDSTKIHAEDVRCFAGNSNNAKVTVCHRTSSASNPCVKICIDQNAVQEHLSHGDFLGNCTPGCVAPTYTRGVPTFVETTASTLDATVMPNPTTSFFEVAISAKKGIPVTMTVNDVYGRLIQKNTKVDVNRYNQLGQNWKAGIYFIEIMQGNERKVLKVIKTN